MKLYATTTSERATKGQGGNRELDILILAEKLNGIPTRSEVLRLIVRNEDNNLIIWLVNYETGESVPIIGKDFIEQKAKKQKGEGLQCPNCYAIDTTGNTDCARHRK